MKFNLRELVLNNVVIHCATEREAELLLKSLHSLGGYWRGTQESLLKKSYWEEYTENTLYFLDDFPEITFNTWQKVKDSPPGTYDLITFNDLIITDSYWSDCFCKEDLKNGMIVNFRSGLRCLKMGDKLIPCLNFNIGDTYKLEDYTTNLCSKIAFEHDIMSVYQLVSFPDDASLREAIWWDKGKRILLWYRRNKVKWTEIPRGTKVHVWNNDTDKREYNIRSFYGFDKNLDYPFIAYHQDQKDLITWKHAELILE